jgi:hypothetical protein
MAAITWRNVAGENLSRNVLPLMAAQDSFNKSFDMVDKALADRKQAQSAFNDNKFKDYLASFKTPDELQSAIDSGAVDQFRQQFGTQMDQNLARTGAQTALTTERDQANTAAAFQKQVQDRQAKPIFDAYKTAALNKDQATMDRLVADNPSLSWADTLGWARDAKQKADTNALEVQGAQQRIKLNGEQGVRQQTEFKQSQDTLNQTRDATAHYEQALAEHRAKVAESQKTLGFLAKQIGLPTTTGGLVDVGALSDSQRTALGSMANMAGVEMPPSDTLALQAARDSMPSNVRPDIAAKMYGQYQQNGWSTGITPVGTDKAVTEQLQARKDALTENYNKHNIFARSDLNPYSPDTTFLDYASKIMPDNKPEAIEMDQKARTLVNQKFPGSDGVLRPATKQEVLYAMSLTTDGPLSNPSYFQLENRLKDVMKNPEIEAQLAEYKAREANGSPVDRLNLYNKLGGESRLTPSPFGTKKK